MHKFIQSFGSELTDMIGKALLIGLQYSPVVSNCDNASADWCLIPAGCAMDEGIIHSRQRKTLSREFIGSIHDVYYPLEGVRIRSNCETGTFNVSAEEQHHPWDGE